MAGDETKKLTVVGMYELADALGVAQTRVSGYLKKGILTEASFAPNPELTKVKKFYLELAIDEVRRNLNLEAFHRTQRIKKNKEKKKQESARASENAEPKKIKVESGSQGDSLDRYNVAKAEHEEHKVRLIRQKLDENNRRLMDVERVKKAVYSYNSRVREAILNIPDQLGPELYAAKSLFDLQERLRKGLNQALTNLDRLKDRIDKITETDDENKNA